MRGPATSPLTSAKPPVALSVPRMDDVNVRANLPFAKIAEGELWLDVYTPPGEAPKGGWLQHTAAETASCSLAPS